MNRLPEGTSTLQNGKYKIVKVLGQGGFGITYLAIHTLLKKEVAVKEFFPSVFCEREEDHSVTSTATNKAMVQKLKAKFTKEALHIASLRHPNIIKIFDIFEENNTAYYVMDYVEGSSLQQMVKENGPLSSDKILKYVREIGSALDYIHTQKIGHYDVKPGNILIDSSTDDSVLIDFGLSKQYNDEGDEQTSSLIGHSNGYAPVEQYNQSEKLTFSPTTDTYSLAATLYFLSSGKRPQVSTDIVAQGLIIDDGVPDKIKPIIKRGLSVAQRKRYASCKDLIDDLENAYKSNRTVDVVRNLFGSAKSGLSKINPGSRENISVISVDSPEVDDSTEFKDRPVDVKSDNPTDSARSEVTENPAPTNDKKGSKFRSKYHQLTAWLDSHPKLVKYWSLGCNIVIALAIAYQLWTCCRIFMTFIKYYIIDIYFISYIVLTLFTIFLWIDVRKSNQSKFINKLVSITYALIWVLPVWNDFTFVIPYLIGLIIIYACYKLPKVLQLTVLGIFSVLIGLMGVYLF